MARTSFPVRAGIPQFSHLVSSSDFQRRSLRQSGSAGGYEAPAIGADSAVSSCGTIEFWQPGNVTARSGNGALLGDPTSSAVDATGSVSFFSGTVTLQSSALRHYREKQSSPAAATFTSRSARPPTRRSAVDQAAPSPVPRMFWCRAWRQVRICSEPVLVRKALSLSEAIGGWMPSITS